jgi:aspartate/methionine/tyrosine aminotransferase
VDEVYREALFEAAPPSAVHLGPEFVVTSSLTKAYGLGGLRCGWFVADPETARRAWRLNDLIVNIPPHAAERLGEIALRNLPALATRARDLLALNRPLLFHFLDAHPELLPVRPAYGTVVFPRLPGRVDELVRVFREKYEGTVVPGSFFGLPDHFRIGIGGRTESLALGLERLGAALDELGS